ncbi:hemolysin family protein [Carnobacterium divergens]|uniref:hemolysin family protein n=1 Tax=Carnobacterium divergens TaxID=2748 RepID=UPI0028925A68|nr:hemolysin family protein [Carnobacterium divergens]MDT2010514.1 hemolysin family protein [Carnobacterium divergens]
MTPDPGSQSIVGQLILILALTFLNAFFASAEIALVSLNKNKMENQANEGDRKAEKLVKLLENPNSFLATIQVGITLAGFFSSASAATSIATRLEPVFNYEPWAKEVSIIIVTVVLSYVTLVFGELYPKRIAMQKAEEVSKMSVGIISLIEKLMKPFVAFLSFSTNILVKLTPMEIDLNEDKLTREEMRFIIESGQKDGVLEASEFHMLKGVFSLDTKMAREIMVPRTDTFMIDINDSDDMNIDLLLDCKYSRVPVYEEDKDKIIGVIHLKNILKEARRVGFEKLVIKDTINEALFVPETIFTDDLLFELKKTQNQMAILLDEYGGVVGIVTLEDLVEEIVGEIEDEYDEISDLYAKIDDGSYLVQGRMPIEKFNDLFEVEIEGKDVDTIAGYMLTELGTIPEQGEHLTLVTESIELTTQEVENSRLVSILVKPLSI